MTNLNTYLQTAAAICSAIAAIAAVYVAKNSSTFQKNSLLKKANIEQMLKLLQQLHNLKSLTGQDVFGAADEDFTGLKQRILETRDSVKTLFSMTSSASNADLIKVRDVVYALNEYNVFARDDNTQNVDLSRQLDDAISALQNIYHKEIK